MKVFVFDLFPYGENLEHLKNGERELPWPLPKRHFKPDVAVRTYEEHLAAWEELDKLGFDGVGFNEHHTSPYGLMNSPNLLASAASQRTKQLKLLIYGNLLPIHDPLRMAEELSMIDCLSNGRLISGFARGIPREHSVYKVPLRSQGHVSRKRGKSFGGHGRRSPLVRRSFLVLSRCRHLAASRATATSARLGPGERASQRDEIE